MKTDARQARPEGAIAIEEATEDLLNVARALEPIIRQHADEAESNRRLSQAVVHAMAEAGLFRMWVPQALGGLEVPPLTLYRVIEEVARLDGSTGWCLMIGGASSVTGAFVADQAAEDMFGRNPLAVIGGSIAGFGKAVAHKDGYLVSGRWPYASGCQHCGWLLALCHVIEGDQPRLTAAGMPECEWCISPPRESPSWRRPGTSAAWLAPGATISPSSRSSSPRRIRGDSPRGFPGGSTTLVLCISSRWSRCSGYRSAPSPWGSPRERWTPGWLLPPPSVP